jgi:hypothetical protein
MLHFQEDKADSWYEVDRFSNLQSAEKGLQAVERMAAGNYQIVKVNSEFIIWRGSPVPYTRYKQPVTVTGGALSKIGKRFSFQANEASVRKSEKVNNVITVALYRLVNDAIFEKSPLKNPEDLSYEDFRYLLETVLHSITGGMADRWQSSDVASKLGIDGDRKAKLANKYFAELHKLATAN